MLVFYAKADLVHPAFISKCSGVGNNPSVIASHTSVGVSELYINTPHYRQRHENVADFGPNTNI